MLTVALLLILDSHKHALVSETNPFEHLREELEIRAAESDAAPRRETADVRTVASSECDDAAKPNAIRARELGSRSAHSRRSICREALRPDRASARPVLRQGLRRASA